jgi:hypothetical protein
MLRYYHFVGLVAAIGLVAASIALDVLGYRWARYLYFLSLIILSWFGQAWKQQRKRRREEARTEDQESSPGGWGFPM